MHYPNMTRTGRGRMVAAAVTVAFALSASLPAMAQDADESLAPDVSEGIAFPVMLGGQLLSPTTYSGEEWLAQFSGEEPDTAFIDGTNAFLESVGASLDDVSVKSALYEPVANEAAVVLAMRIDGTDARDWVEGAVDVLVADVEEPGLVMRPLSTKWTLRVTDQARPGVYPRTIYLRDDTAWFIQGDNDYVWEALDQLPDAVPTGASSADSLYTDVPLTLTGERRIGLYESTEPLFLPTLSERLGEGIEDWLLELYLEAGISPSEMLGVITWWGIEAAQDGIQIEGYRLPEGGEELTQRLLEDVFLIRPPEVSLDPDSEEALDLDPVASLLAGVEFTEEEIGGRTVTTLDYGDTRQHIFSSADTIWVISDPLGEREKVEEAIATLP
ncbi:MAG: hypothetical protein AB1Z67_01325 [Candidatus Limnocylindrales bacterium]